MDWTSFITPLSLSVGAILSIYMFLQLAVDTKRSNQLRQLRRIQKNEATSNNMRTVSAVITLTKKADTILPLLDHLASHNYNDLQVVVVVKHTAGKNALRSLRRYQRDNKPLNLRIIKHRKGLHEVAIARRLKSEIIVHLTSSDRLSPQFFYALSQRFTDENLDGLQLRHHIALNARLSRALTAWMAIQHDTVMTLSRKAHTAQVYRRKSFIAGTVRNVGYSSAAAMSNDEMKSKYSGALQVLFFVLLSVAVLLGATILQTSLGLILLAPFLGMLLFMSGQLVTTAEYTFIDRLNLLLLLPFEPFLEALKILSQLVRSTLQLRRSS